MEPMMIRAILGDTAADADEAFYNEVQSAVREFIDKTTGIQTLVQMRGLVNLVRRFRCVPEDAILDEAGYKRVYNDALIGMVGARIGQLEAGELNVEDFAPSMYGVDVGTAHGHGLRCIDCGRRFREGDEIAKRVVGSREADKDPQELSLGLHHRLRPGLLWSLAATEDIRPETAADLVLSSDLQWEF